MDNEDPKQAVVLILALLGAWISYKTGIYKWEFMDQLAFATIFAGFVVFLILYFKRRFQ